MLTSGMTDAQIRKCHERLDRFLVDLLEPDAIVVGGGVAAVLQPFFDNVRERLPAWSINSRCQEIPLLPAHYGAQAGIAGGATLCK